jgi:hypothetical protein
MRPLLMDLCRRHEKKMLLLFSGSLMTRGSLARPELTQFPSCLTGAEARAFKSIRWAGMSLFES